MRDTEDRLRVLEQQVDELSGDLRVLRTLVDQDHGSALNKIRYVTEKVLHGLCGKHKVSWGAKEPTLENMIGPLIAAKVIPKNVSVHVRTVQTNASPGSHFQEDALSATHVQVAQIALLELLEWYYRGDEAPAPTASQSLPRASLTAPVRRRAPMLLLALAGVAVAGGVYYWVAVRGGDAAETPEPGPAAGAATPVLREPKAGLAAVASFEQATGEADELASESLWQAAADDFARAAGQTAAPARWLAGEPFARGMVAIMRGELQAAAEHQRKAMAADPDWPAPHAALALVLARQDKVDDALASAREAQRLEPKQWRWVVTGARVHASANQLDHGIREYRRALVMAPKEASLLAELALVYHASGLDAEAERNARDALAVDADMVAPRIMLAERALELQDGKTALEEANRALAASPTSVAALLAAGDAQMLLGKTAEATTLYRKAIDEWRTGKTKGVAEARIAEVEKALAMNRLKALRARAPTDRSRAKADRLKGIKVSKECMENPLAAGCM